MKRVASVLFLILAFVGCTKMDKPLTFSQHNVGTLLFSASSLKIRYGSLRRNISPDELTRAKNDKDDLSLGGPALGYRAFGAPLEVEWKSADGTPYAVKLDLEKIFPGHKVLHNEDPATFDPSMPLVMDPTIIVEVNDKTLTLYLDSFIGVLPPDPGHVRNVKRNRLIAYQKTFS